jgi:hypothetical protein
MPCWDLFWLNFLEVFPKALGGSLGVLPAVLGFWGGLIAVLRRQDRLDEARRESAYGLNATARDDASRLRTRVAYLEGRLLPFDEARRQREG